MNAQNEDNPCFEWAILPGLHPANKDPHHTGKRSDHLGNHHNIDLLLLDNDTYHYYVWIKNLGHPLFKNSKHKECKHPCYRCLHVFSIKDLLENHMKDCIGINGKPQRIMILEKSNTLQFTSHHIQMPYIIYVDSESLNIPMAGCAYGPQMSTTWQIAQQTSCNYNYLVIS